MDDRCCGVNNSTTADLFNSATKELVEAKATTDRGAIRMAIGQLADYRRFVDDHPSPDPKDPNMRPYETIAYTFTP
jgi:hypothetical protein